MKLLRASALLALSSVAAWANTVSFQVSGTLSSVFGTADTTLAAGTPFTATVSYDPSTASTNPGCSSSLCDYSVTDPTMGLLQFTFGSDPAIHSTFAAFGVSDLSINVNTAQNGGDILALTADVSSSAFSSLPSDFGFGEVNTGTGTMTLNLYDPTGTAFADTSLPTSIDPSVFSSGNLTMNLNLNLAEAPYTGSLYVSGDVGTATPEPATFLLVGATLAAAGLIRRRK